MTAPLFRRLLGQNIEELPPLLRQAHDADDMQRWAGKAVATRSANPIAKLLCRMMRLPSPGEDVPVSVLFERRSGTERWSRAFAGRRYRSSLAERNGLMFERMGPATNIFRLSAVAGQLHLDLVGFRFLGIPFPGWARPHCQAREREEAGHYVFDVPVSLPWLGHVIRYTGRMERIDD
ncbi:DUF4166 domain-containing protein [Sphingobium sp. 3R8]|uniref:DUF4166 domain-containing protein n=1 Tax=Sphingobium sp. 3R8 TaxID=2874921 RepID=UPI001CCE6502|nr:DUF4166 domain-containing protein [Sphingobium sp. 3R8]MBZ9648472.1 DUF4166 domain-containing protein [Sphingobium sp. 3R8]